MPAAPAARAAGLEPAGIDPVAAAVDFVASLTRPGPLVVAVSGGGDSLALLHALHQAGERAPEVRRPLFVVTVDHGLRSASAREARFVAELCGKLGIHHRILVWQGDKPSAGLQAAAREARYHLLADAARQVDAVGILTAHTADDQVETVTMRAERAPAEFMPGLAGMAPATLFRQSVWILRPFLSLGRASLRHFLSDIGQSWIEDPSNADRRYERVRVRSAGPVVGLDAIARAQRQRRRLSEIAAAVIAERATFHRAGLVRLGLDGLRPDDAGAVLAVETLAALTGGRAHRPGQEASLRLARLLAEPAPPMTLARAVAQRRKAALFLHRERRSLPVASVAAGSEALWDCRYRVRNDRPTPLAVRPPTAAELAELASEVSDEGFPPALIRRALAAEPFVSGDEKREGGFLPFEGDWRRTRHFALFDLFLPCFDLKLAEGIATLFSRQGYGRPPAAPPD